MTDTTGPPAARPSRRVVLAGTAAVALGGLAGAGWLVERDLLPGRIELERRFGGAGHAAGVPDVEPGPIARGAFVSAARGGVRTAWAVAYPPGTDPDRPRGPDGGALPVCVVLHGRGDGAADLETLGYPRFLAAAVRAGGPRFAMAAADGGDRYWHRRAAGDDSGAMVLTEFLPMLARRGLAARATDRIALLGWSMGGYGALLLASRLGRDRVAAVAAESPALWRRPGDSAAGAFDDAADWRRNDVFARRPALAGIPIRIDCGRADPFYRADQAFAAGLPGRPRTFFGDGDHSGGFWRAMAPKSIAFVGNTLG